MEAQQQHEAQTQARQGPPVEGVVEETEWDFFQSKYIAPACLFLFGVVVQTYRPLFDWWSLTVVMAEMILGVTLGVMCLLLGIFMTTQIPMIGIIANVINYHLNMPYIIAYQLMPLPFQN